MENDSLKVQILLELALQQSYEGTPEQIIKRMLPMYMRKLNCFLAAVINADGLTTMIPYAMKDYDLWTQIKKDVINHAGNASKSVMERSYDTDYILAYPLHDYGWLILGKKQPLDSAFRNELKQVVNQFGRILCFAAEDEQLKLFKSLINNSSDGIQVSQEDGRMYYVNAVSAERLGIKQSEVQRYRVSDFERLFEEEGTWQRHVDELKNSDYVTVVGTNVHQSNGQVFPVEVTAKYITIGGKGFVIANSRDISERMEAAEKLRLLQEQMELAINGSNDGIWDWDILTGRTFFSRRWKAILGYDDEEVRNEFNSFASLIYEGDRDHVNRFVSQYLNNEIDKYEVDFRMKHKDGSLRWITAKGAALRDAQGKPYRMAGSHTDITKRKQAEEELLKTKELLEQTSQVARIGAYSVDLIAQTVVWSDVTRQIHEVAPTYQPTIAEAINFYKEGESRELIIATIQEMIETGTTMDVELQIVTAKGHERWVRAIGKPEYQDGACVRFYGTFQDVHEEKQRSLELEHTKQQLESIFNEMEDVVWSVELPANKMVFLTPSAEKLCGIPIQDLMQSRWWWKSVMHPADMGIIQEMGDQLEKNGMYEVRHRIVALDGTIKWLQNQGKIVYDENGKAIRLDGIATDRTKQYEAEEQLHQEVILQKILIDISSTYINIKLEEVAETIQKSLRELGEFVKADRSYIFDYDFQKNTASNTYEWCAEGIDPEIHNLQDVPIDFIPQWVSQHQQGQAFYVGNVQELPDEGEGCLRRILEPQGIKSLMAIPMLDQGELVGFVGFDSVKSHHQYTDKESRLLFLYAQMLINVRNRQNFLQNLTIQEEKYRNIIANMNLGMLEEDTDNTILFANQSFCTTSGYSLDELIGKRAIDLYVAEDSAPATREMELRRAKGLSTALETKVMNKQGQPRWWFISSAPNYNDKGQLTGYISIHLDITDQKKLEQEQRLLLSLTQNQNDRLKNFAHIVSHNLRSHSVNIKALIDFLFEAKPELREFELTQLMKQASDNLLETIGHLSEVAIMNTNEQRQLSPVDLAQTVEKAIGNVSALAMNSKVKIINDLHQPVTVLGVPAYLDSIVLNLLTNAIKYRSPEKDSFVRISCVKVKNRLLLSVEDNGLGIDLHRHGRKLFGMYKTFHGHSDARGVGLFITKNQVEAMGGRIDVESEVGKGTIFKIHLQHEKN